MAKGPVRLRRLWISSVFGRLAALLFFMSLLTLYVYVVGNRQGFADDTLVSLFLVESWMLALCALTGVFSALSYALTLPFRSRMRLDRIIFSGAASMFSILLYLVVALLQAFMDSYG